ncbi:cysteine synthase [Ceratobasidium sp. AG-Ba]|nr:cysteine synthase [Ceratobasidium sp. AG-Ba]
MEAWYSNPAAREFRTENESNTALHRFHSQCVPNYSVTPLVNMTPIAQELSIGHVFLKDESSRLGLPAFKILGASWAIFNIFCERFGLNLATATLDDIRDCCRGTSYTLCAATDGNHGRAVARMAALLGLDARIYVPTCVPIRSRQLIASEGATVVPIPGDYDETILAARDACQMEISPNSILVQDTSWEGYTRIPMQIVIGYATIFVEIDAQLLVQNLPPPSLVVVPVGVGSLAHAAVLHYRSKVRSTSPSIMTVEPVTASCLLKSLKATQPMTISTSNTIMHGLNCGTVSGHAWPDLLRGVDIATSVADDEAGKAVRDLQGLGVSSGPCGAATIAALRCLAQYSHVNQNEPILKLDETSVVIVISSESSEVYLDSLLN